MNQTSLPSARRQLTLLILGSLSLSACMNEAPGDDERASKSQQVTTGDSRSTSVSLVAARDTPLEFTINSRLRVEIPGPPDGKGGQRPVTAWRHGPDTSQFVSNELVLFEDDPRRVAEFAKVFNAELVYSVEGRSGKLTSVHLFRLPLEGIETDNLEEVWARMESHARGVHELSEASGRALILRGAEALRARYKVGLNWMSESTAFKYLDQEAFEAPGPAPINGVPLTPEFPENSFRYPHLNEQTPRTNVTRAWQHLELANKLGNHSKVAFVDKGFALSDDLPPVFAAAATTLSGPALNQANWTDNDLGQFGRWHGLMAAHAGFGVPHNNIGAAGPGGDVADLMFIQTAADSVSSVEAYFTAANSGVDIISISRMAKVLAAGELFAKVFENALLEVQAMGPIVVAGAGNDKEDVDREDSVFGWEAALHIPCETPGVICVGGIDNNEVKHVDSNFGSKGDVDIFAPFVVAVSATPDSTCPNQGDGTDEGLDCNVALHAEGTSASTPFVAGVVALIRAANPNLTPGQVLFRLITSANMTSTDPQVSRMVDAMAAVAALPSTLQIVHPPEGYEYEGGVTKTTHTFSNNVLSPVVESEWFVHGFSIGEGNNLESKGFSSVGSYPVAVVVKRADGTTDGDMVKVTALNVAPFCKISSPAHMAGFAVGHVLLAQATIGDPNVEWELNPEWQVGDALFSFPGDHIKLTPLALPLTQPGNLDVTCRVADVWGLASTQTITIQVFDRCGDGVVDPEEACDDGGTTSGDGCADDCKVEPGYQCNASDVPQCVPTGSYNPCQPAPAGYPAGVETNGSACSFHADCLSGLCAPTAAGGGMCSAEYYNGSSCTLGKPAIRELCPDQFVSYCSEISAPAGVLTSVCHDQGTCPLAFPCDSHAQCDGNLLCVIPSGASVGSCSSTCIDDSDCTGLSLCQEVGMSGYSQHPWVCVN